MMNIIVLRLFTASLLSLCAVGLSVQSQTASPGPPSRNANVDREDPNKPDTPEHEIPSQEAPGSGNNDDRGAAGTSTPTASDGSSASDNRDPTQPTQRNSTEQAKESDKGDKGDKSDKSDKGDERVKSDKNHMGSNATQGADTPPPPVTPH